MSDTNASPNLATGHPIAADTWQLRDRVCAEHRPKMTALMRMQDDVAALQVALNIVQRATDALGILPGTPFPARPSPSESPPDQGHMPAKAGPVTGEPVHPT
ncbi:TPA: hypothetical protein ACXJFW_001141 [Pseudomonas aeruginosa]